MEAPLQLHSYREFLLDKTWRGWDEPMLAGFGQFPGQRVGAERSSRSGNAKFRFSSGIFLELQCLENSLAVTSEGISWRKDWEPKGMEIPWKAHPGRGHSTAHTHRIFPVIRGLSRHILERKIPQGFPLGSFPNAKLSQLGSGRGFHSELRL